MAVMTGNLLVYVVDSARRKIEGAVLEVEGPGRAEVAVDDSGAFVVSGLSSQTTVRLRARVGNLADEPLDVVVRDEIQQVVIGLPAKGELTYRRGSSRLAFRPDYERYLVLANGDEAPAHVSAAMAEVGLGAERVSAAAQDGQEPESLTSDQTAHVVEAGPDTVEQLAANLQQRGLGVRLARLICHREDEPPLGLTGSLVVVFGNGMETKANSIAADHGLKAARELGHADNAFLLERSGVPDYDILETAKFLAADERTVSVEPDLIVMLEHHSLAPARRRRSLAFVPSDPLYGAQNYLELIRADKAWDRLASKLGDDRRGGSPSVCIGIVDFAGVDPGHPDLNATLEDGTSKLQGSWDFAARSPRPVAPGSLTDDHGTQCAGSATAAFDEVRGLAGVAPNCRLLAVRPLRWVADSSLADAFLWMAGFRTGGSSYPPLPTQPADVISMSDAPTGAVVPTVLSDTFDRLTGQGRGGRGVVLCLSISNAGYNDFTKADSGYYSALATLGTCLAVGGSIGKNPTSPTSSIHPPPSGAPGPVRVNVDRRALYSPFGSAGMRKPDLVSPSATASLGGGLYVDPIMSDVRVGTGTVNGCLGGLGGPCPGPGSCCDYSPTFGGTSHAAPTVAGAACLLLSVRPALTWSRAQDILRRSCVKIDPRNRDPIGQWTTLPSGEDFSRWYGCGRLDVRAAVDRALMT